MHEQGPAHGFRMVPGHNDPTDYHYDHDPIYHMGAMVEKFCRKEATAGRLKNIALSVRYARSPSPERTAVKVKGP